MTPNRRIVRLLLALFAAACSSASEAELLVVDLAPDPVQLKRFRTLQLMVTVTDAAGAPVSGNTPTYVVRNPAIASVSSAGVLTALAAGLTWVVAEAGAARDSVPVTVTAGGPLIVSILPDTVVVQLGASAPATATVMHDGEAQPQLAVTWSVASTTVAAVSPAGIVSGLQSGVTRLIATVAGVADSARVVSWRPFTGSLQPRIAVSPEGAWGIALSTTGVLYITQARANTLARFNLPGLVPAGTVTMGKTPVDVIFNASGSLAYVSNTFDAQLSIVDVAAGTATTTDIGDIPYRLRMSSDNTRLLVTTSNGLLREFNPTTGAPIVSHTIATGGLNGFTANFDGTRLYISGYSTGRIYEYLVSSGAVRNNYVAPNLQDVVISPDNTELYVASETGPIFVVATGTMAPIDSIGALNTFALRVSADGHFLFASHPRHLYVIDRLARRVVRDFTVTAGARRLAFDPATSSLLIASDSGYIEVIR